MPPLEPDDPPLASGDMLDLPLTPDGPKRAPESPAARWLDLDEPTPEPRRKARRSPPGRRPWRGLGLVLLLLAGGALGGIYYLVSRPRVAAEPDSLDFGVQRVGEEAAPLRLVLRNAGRREMRIERLELAGASPEVFDLAAEQCTGRDLAGGAECEVSLAFRPAAAGQNGAVLAVSGRLSNSPASFELRGTGVAPLAELAPGSVDFGAGGVGSIAGEREITVTNSGSAPLRIAGSRLVGDAAGDFERRNEDCREALLEPGESCALAVLFRPRSAGPRQASLVLESDALGEAPAARLSGVGEWSGPALTAERQALDFGPRRVGDKAAELTLRLVNRHGEAASGAKLTLDQAAAGAFTVRRDGCSGKTVAGGAACEVVVAFAPRGEGAARGRIELRQPTAPQPVTIDLAGAGVVPRLVFADARLDFGEVRLGAARPDRALALENRGSAAVRVEALALSGDGFSIHRDGCSRTQLEPRARCTVGVRFAPDRAGRHEARVTVRPDPAEGPKSVELRGLALAPLLTADRELLEFGDVRRTEERESALLLANRGTAELRFGRPEVTGEAGASFELAASTCGERLAPSDSCTLRVRFRPQEEGRLAARLVLPHDGASGPHEVPLGGRGLPPPVPRLEASPGALRFAAEPVGGRSAILAVSVRSAGTGRLKLGKPALTGEHAGDFYVVPATCQAAPYLVPGSDCTVGVRFVPTAAGPRRARLELPSNTPGPSWTVELFGEGLP